MKNQNERQHSHDQSWDSSIQTISNVGKSRPTIKIEELQPSEVFARSHMNNSYSEKLLKVVRKLTETNSLKLHVDD